MKGYVRVLLKIIYIVIIVALILGSIALMGMHFVKRWSSHEPPTKYKETVVKPLHTTLGFHTSLLGYSFIRESVKEYNEEDTADALVIPGLYGAESIRSGVKEMCTSMVPQSVCIAEDYLLIGAYCKTGQHYSVIYVLDKESYEYIKTVILPARYHVGGLAYDRVNKRLWLSCHKDVAQANSISYYKLLMYDYDRYKAPVTFDSINNLYTIPRNSFLAYYNSRLYIGYFQKKDESVLQTFEIDNKTGELVKHNSSRYQQSYGGKLPRNIVTPINVATIGSKVQGITFSKYRMFVTESYGVTESRLATFSILTDDVERQRYTNDEAISVIELPQKLEQITVDGEDMYSIYESAAYAYRYYSFPSIDRVIKMKVDDVLRHGVDKDIFEQIIASEEAASSEASKDAYEVKFDEIFYKMGH
ncbi:MAG: hypothetical protein K5656_09520 [Lachnospiraceae bacterium]|nr:hypothetical protein [Lachnospiraceae bacterium]